MFRKITNSFFNIKSSWTKLIMQGGQRYLAFPSVRLPWLNHLGFRSHDVEWKPNELLNNSSSLQVQLLSFRWACFQDPCTNNGATTMLLVTYVIMTNKPLYVAAQWKRINRKQSTRWQHLSRLKASAFLFEIFLLGVKKHKSLYLRLVLLSSEY
jgi:hypothetical protein